MLMLPTAPLCLDAIRHMSHFSWVGSGMRGEAGLGQLKKALYFPFFSVSAFQCFVTRGLAHTHTYTNTNTFLATPSISKPPTGACSSLLLHETT